MPTYAEPWRWSPKTREMEEKKRLLRQQIEQGAQAQKFNRVFGQFTDKQRAGIAAIDENLNLKEADAEMYDQRIADEYPQGTTFSGGIESRNQAGYGQPQQLPVDAVGPQGGEAPIPLVQNPFYREGGILPKMIPADLARELMSQGR